MEQFQLFNNGLNSDISAVLWVYDMVFVVGIGYLLIYNSFMECSKARNGWKWV